MIKIDKDKFSAFLERYKQIYFIIHDYTHTDVIGISSVLIRSGVKFTYGINHIIDKMYFDGIYISKIPELKFNDGRTIISY